MKSALSALFILAFCLQSGGAGEQIDDRRRLASPDNRHLLTFRGGDPSFPDAFTVEDFQGRALFSSRDCPSLRDVRSYHPRSARWSSDGLVLAIAAGHPKLLLPYIFARRGDVFVSVPTPPLAATYDNPWILPTRWLPDRTLRLTISGPHAGKSRDRGYRGEARIRLTLEPPKCTKTFERMR